MTFRARNGEISITVTRINDETQYECKVNISTVNEEDNGEWKAVLTGGDGHTKEIHEYTQVVKVQGNQLDINIFTLLFSPIKNLPI